MNGNAFQEITKEGWKRKLVIIFATLVVGSILSAGSSAQRRGMSGEQMYNPQTVETISGVVVSVGKYLALSRACGRALASEASTFKARSHENLRAPTPSALEAAVEKLIEPIGSS